MAKLMAMLRWGVPGLLLVGFSGYAGLLGTLYFGQRDILYHPTRIVPEPAAYGVPQMVPQRVVSSGGAQPLIWWAPPGKDGYPVIVYFHGNAGHLGTRAKRARRYLDAGYGVLLAGYRYNAGAGGEPSEQGLLADARAAVEFARDEGYETKRLVFYGESLGTGIATAMAAEYGGAGLVLESAYSNIADVAQDRYWYFPVQWLVMDSFDSVARIRQVRSPVFVVHGERDRVTPAWSARKLLEMAPGPKEGHFLANGDHGNLYRLGAGKLVLDFLERRVLPRLDFAADAGQG